MMIYIKYHENTTDKVIHKVLVEILTDKLTGIQEISYYPEFLKKDSELIIFSLFLGVSELSCK